LLPEKLAWPEALKVMVRSRVSVEWLCWLMERTAYHEPLEEPPWVLSPHWAHELPLGPKSASQPL